MNRYYQIFSVRIKDLAVSHQRFLYFCVCFVKSFTSLTWSRLFLKWKKVVTTPNIHPSIFLTCYPILCRIGAGAYFSCTPWIGRYLITGLTRRDRQSFTLTFVPIATLESPVKITYWEPTQAQREHVNSTLPQPYCIAPIISWCRRKTFLLFFSSDRSQGVTIYVHNNDDITLHWFCDTVFTARKSSL